MDYLGAFVYDTVSCAVQEDLLCVCQMIATEPDSVPPTLFRERVVIKKPAMRNIPTQ